MEAALHKLTEKAFAGDIRALTALIHLYRAGVPDDPFEQGTGPGGGPSQEGARTEQEAAAYEALCELIRDGMRAPDRESA